LVKVPSDEHITIEECQGGKHVKMAMKGRRTCVEIKLSIYLKGLKRATRVEVSEA
jgi:hypothetical protein